MSPDFLTENAELLKFVEKKLGKGVPPSPKYLLCQHAQARLTPIFFYKAQFDTENNAVGWKFSATVQWFSQAVPYSGKRFFGD